MIDRAYLLRLHAASAIMCAVAAGGSFLVWRSAPVVLGLLAGYILSAIPFLTWPWLLGLAMRRRRWFAILILLLKLPVYGGILWFLFGAGQPRVHPIALLVGLSFIMVTFLVMRPAAAEEAKCC